MVEMIDRLYQQFDPLRPLSADEQDLYVDWQEQVGADDVKRSLVNSISHAGDQNVWVLFSGHRGVGKSTELNRVQQRLESGVRGTRYFTSFLHAEPWLDLQDATAEEVAFQLIRQLVADLVGRGGMSFKREEALGWGAKIWDWIRQNVQLSGGASWLNVSLTLKDLPADRNSFRDLLRGQLPSLFDAVNERLLVPAAKHLAKQGYDGGVVAIVDDLDKIRLHVSSDAGGVTNQEQLFVHDGDLLRSLRCDVIYTIPIELAYSRARNELLQRFGGSIVHLPLIALDDRDGNPRPPALDALRKVYQQRVSSVGATESTVFDEDVLLEPVLRSTGGHVRSLFIALRELLTSIDELPITEPVVRRGLLHLARDMRRGLQPGDRAVIETVERNGEPVDDPRFFELLRNGYLLAYQDDANDWYAPHPWLSEQKLA